MNTNKITLGGSGSHILYKSGNKKLYGSEEHSKPNIYTFCESIDEMIGGGVPLGMITEVSGQKGVGKTTFCYQLCIDVQIPKQFGGLESESIFIQTNHSFVINRVKVMAKECVAHCKSIIDSSEGSITSNFNKTVNSFLNGMHVIRCQSDQDLLEIVLALDSYLKQNSKIKLVVIDSFAYLFYSKDHDFHSRSKILYSLAQELNRLVFEYGIAVVVTNDMTTRFGKGGSGDYFIPFLGESWSHVPNTRLQFSWHNVGNNSSRTATLIKSPCYPPGKAVFRITSQGIRD